MKKQFFYFLFLLLALFGQYAFSQEKENAKKIEEQKNQINKLKFQTIIKGIEEWRDKK